ncbi:MAG: hypothetical protein ACERKO_10575 [Acetanaerobacterium sp.]
MPLKIIHQTAGAAFGYDGSQYHVLTGYIKTETGQACATDAPFGNPLLAWTVYWQMVDCLMRRRIGTALEKQGLNRYTGESKQEQERS